MSSLFVPANNSPQQQKQPDQTKAKRPRSSLACIRCRKKKVKCDFVQPTCGRCGTAGLPCNYAAPPRRVDGHAFDQLGSHVEELKERMQKMQSELAMMKSNLHPFAPNSTLSQDDSNTIPVMVTDSNGNNKDTNNNMALATSSDQSVTWKLSLSPSGLRIDTNIASVADLYRILLNGISQLNINNDSTTTLFSPESTSRTEHRPYQQSSNKSSNLNNYPETNMTSIENDKGGRLWEIDDNEARRILQEKQATEDVLPKETLDNLMHSCYHTCFLAYQIVDKEAFMQQYMSENGLEPLLVNSINAWVSKHGCIYHNASHHQGTTMGEVYFKNARQLLKKCFDISSPTTIHALLNLYMYQLSSERSSLAYLYIGLAIRMAQDLKFHKKEHMPADLNQRETNKRLWWSAYWLDLCAALESNRPTMVDDKDCDLDYPTRLDHEDTETGYRIHFTVYSIKLMKIRKDITKHLPSEQSGQSLLSAISRLENALTNWLADLPQDLHFDDQSSVFQKTGSFRDEACLILNIQYQTTWIMLHKFFLPKQDQTATPVALLSLNICTKSANLITRMLSIYASNLNWCQFFYAMDGIIASVTIHQVNALSSEKEVSCLAQRNLIITATVLKDSPLTYMVKVCEIIESIEGFLKKNELSSDLSKLPPVSEDSINQQSICSVFHPGVFESQQMLHHKQNSYNSPHHTHKSINGSVSPSVQSSHTVNSGIMNSPQSQTSSTILQVPSQLPSTLFHGNSTAAGQQQQQQVPLSSALHDSIKPAIAFNNANPNMMVEHNMLFNDPNSLMDFNMAGGSNEGDMNQILLGFEMNGGTSSTNSVVTGIETRLASQHIYGGMFDGRNATTSNTSNYSSNNNSPYILSTEPPTSYAYTNTTNAPNDNSTNTYNPSTGTNTTNNTYSNFLSNPGLFGLSASNNPPQGYPASSSSPNSFDNLFNCINMDPATMSALLYNNGGIANYANSYQEEENDVIYTNNGRKRIHREWEDTA
ncbi:fungal-specific transcription factor domain-containing protein [Pilobolus umbonatus]|nr:fungal-specific transcription factor domain-containing protein [Pilobolus umbonatus]